MGLLRQCAWDFHNLCDHLQLSLVRARQDDRLEVRVDGLKGDHCVAPRVALLRPLALVTLTVYRSLLSGSVASRHLHENRLALPCALDGRREEAVRAVGDHRLHRSSDDLRDEHATAEVVPGLDRGPREAIVVDVLWIAECPCGYL